MKNTKIHTKTVDLEIPKKYNFNRHVTQAPHKKVHFQFEKCKTNFFLSIQFIFILALNQV